jgi:predicted 3-demethylubiquinone-9 3-methyltransferase (glyoxalase superfamily)
MQKIRPCLWFDGQAEEAANFYVSVFKNAKMGEVSRMGEGGPLPAGSVITAMFEIEGEEFMALNGGPEFNFTEAISFSVDCKDQAEIDYFWGKLTSDGGEESMCGWLKDKFGVSWQIVPAEMGELLGGDDPEQSKRAMDAMLQMRKLDIRKLRDARAGR